MLEEATGADDAVRPAIRGVIDGRSLEPRVIEPVAYDNRPAVPVRVRMARLTLGPNASFRPPTGACQDVLLLVRSGELRAVGAGIAPPEAPATLYAGDAVRFGPEGDALVQNLGEQTARTVVAFVRDRDAGPPSVTDPGSAEGCRAPPTGDPLVRPIRSTSVRTTAPQRALEGKLRVRILLDADGAGARHGGLSVLEGDPDLVVPEHRHAEAAEILLVEDGSGVMQIGEQRYRVRPGAALYVPPGVLHAYEGDGERGLRAIQVYSPSGPEQRFRRSPERGAGATSTSSDEPRAPGS
ncbi:MAG TPA: cupin domain-containing protein [Sandaracinaceae bacterium LLY-WYZ-13_1]|nr:cupin domain-containing protein [Sandaracinaceae bacterium LLY-WYZ-13_1]